MKPSDIMRTMVRDGFQVNIGGLVEDVVPVSVLREELKDFEDFLCEYSIQNRREIIEFRKRFACVLKDNIEVKE